MLYLAISILLSTCVICATSVWMMKSSWSRQDELMDIVAKATAEALDALTVQLNDSKKKAEEPEEEVNEEE